MTNRLTRHGAACLLAVSLAAAPVAARAADPITSVAFFGDSFLDAGNFDALVRGYTFGAFGFPPPPYYPGRFSSGPVWSERLAALLGMPGAGAPSVYGGQNYAYGGATTGTVNVNFRNPLLTNAVDAARAAAGAPPLDWGALAAGGYGVRNEVLDFVAAHPSGNAGTLAVLLAGGNDFINDLGPDPVAALTNAVTNLVGAATVLRGAGVRDFLVPSLPDLSRTPRGRTLPPAQAALFHDLVGAYNHALDEAFAQFAAATGSNYLGLRLDTLFDNLLRAPERYGLTNTTAPCLFTAAPCATSLFADDIHPSGRAHDLIAQAAYTRVVSGVDVSAVPEPGTLLLLAGGLAGCGVVRRAGRVRRRAA